MDASTTIPFAPSVVAESQELGLVNVFDGVLNAHRQESFDAGYRRATNDLLADFLLISEEFLRRQDRPNPELRQALRAFEQHLERSLQHTATDHSVDGGLGI